MAEAIVIGAGVAGLSAATTLAHAGHRVTLLDRNERPGGRAQTWKSGGFTFDLGPSFYWMPDVFERYFQRFGRTTSELFELKRLDPSYRIVFGPGDHWDLPAGEEAVGALFEQEEPGAREALKRFLSEARSKYELGMHDLVYRPSLSWTEYLDGRLLTGLMRTSVFSSLRKHVRRHFRSERIRRVMEFPVLFLGAAPQDTPALFSLMNHADIALGTWYPMGGMGSLVEGLHRIAVEQGVRFHNNVTVTHIQVKNGRSTGVETAVGFFPAEVVVATADYHHVEQHLLAEEYRSYSASYWDDRKLAPATLLFFVGIDRRLPGLLHHTLFFDASLDEHSADIYTKQGWPRDPLFYVSCTSRTDPGTAPEGMENVVVLIPIASGAEDTTELREHYFEVVMDRLARYLGFDLRPHVRVRRDHCIKDMEREHHAYKGNAYGLANTLTQTGPLRPKVKSRKVKGLYFAGQLSIPGPGVPPALISGQVVADLIRSEQRP